MAKPLSFGKVEVSLTTSMEPSQGVPESNTPFRIAILGDFSGRANRGVLEPGAKLARRRPAFIDRDNFDEVLTRHNVELRLGSVGKDATPLVLRFNELDDFHPDRIFEHVELFQTLRQTRKRLGNPATFAEAAAEVQAWAKTEPPRSASHELEPAPVVPPPEPNPLSVENLFDEMIVETRERFVESKATHDGVDWNAIMREIVEPFVIPGTDPRQPELVACVDATAAALMRAILHHPDFQATEAAWRALYFLVRRVETDTQLKLYLFDISKAELAADLSSAEDLRSTGTYKLLVEQTVGTAGAELWAVLAGNYTFDRTVEDAELLGRLSKIAQRAKAPFIAAAHPHMVGCESFAATPDPDDWQCEGSPDSKEAWSALRQIPEAVSVGLALPRFLLRLPYGKQTDPTEQFSFEEYAEGFGHEQYLWGNPSFACLCLLAQAFTQQGWSLRPGAVRDIDGLPVHVCEEEGESRIKPCAESILTERAAEVIATKGLMPLLSIRDQDAVRLATFRSLSSDAKPLAGRWS